MKEYQDISLKVISPQDKSQKLKNHKPFKIIFPSDMTLLKKETVTARKAVRKVATEEIIEMLNKRFQSLNEEVFLWWNGGFLISASHFQGQHSLWLNKSLTWVEKFSSSYVFKSSQERSLCDVEKHTKL